MAELLDGKKIKKENAEILKTEIESFGTKLSLAIIQIGDRKDSHSYIAAKKKFGEKIGVNVIHKQFGDAVSMEEVERTIQAMNNDTAIQGIIIQLPLPLSLDQDHLLNLIDAEKDVDGLGSIQRQRLFEGREDAVIPATTRGILTLLNYYKIPIEGKKVTMVGRSSLVGKPTALAFINNNATVTVCHSKTVNLAEETKKADILIVAIGKAAFINKNYVKEGQVVIDVGINTQTDALEDGIMLPKLIGDVEYSEVKEIVGAITPVPGGVGQLTVLSLFQNLIEVYKRKIKIN